MIELNIIETDWLNSTPVFYNEKTKNYSYNINDVIEWNDLEFDPDGLSNYLDFGYSILGHTPIKNVKFMRWSSVMRVEGKHYIDIILKNDPADNYIDAIIPEKTIWEKIYENVNHVSGKVVIATSGGYDSRILNYMYNSKKDILAFTYGISENQAISYEVVYARELCKKLKIKWQRIPLKNFNNRIDEWVKLYGCSTHAHGMYHMEFFEKIAALIGNKITDYTFLSGIIGDAWAGTVVYQPNIDVNTFNKLGYTHGLHASSNYCHIKSNKGLIESYLERNKYKLKTAYWQVIASMRMKMILLSYLLKIPKVYGFKNIHAPFLNIDIALSMLNIPPKRRNERLWQRDFFHNNKIDLESWNLSADYTNVLDWFAMQAAPPRPLNIHLLRELFEDEYLGWINSHYRTNNSAMSHYYTLYPLQVILEKRNSYLHKEQNYSCNAICSCNFKKKDSIIYIGADFIPTETNKDFFINGNIKKLVGEELSHILNNSELNVFNLELPLVNKVQPILKSGPTLYADIKCINLYKKFKPLLLTLANNHILDQGDDGVKTTIDILTKNEIDFLGAGMNITEAKKPFIKRLNNGKKVAFYACADYEFTIADFQRAGANPFDALTSFDVVNKISQDVDYTIILYHGGREEYRYPSPYLQRCCRKFIEKGANLVVVQHTHCIGCREDYKNGVIIYGQGNFLFNLNHDDEYFDTGLLLKVFLGDNIHIKEIPIIKNDCGITIADDISKQEIMNNYYKRSKEITDHEFLEKNYMEFASQNIKWYMEFFWPGAWDFFYKNLSSVNYVHMLNNIRCDAHRELIQYGLINLINGGNVNEKL